MFTRSKKKKKKFQSVPNEKEVWFLCDKKATQTNSLHQISKKGMGKVFKEAVDKNNNEQFCVKLCTAINSEDATVSQILDEKHVRRCINTHIITLQALHSLYQETIFEQHSDVVDRLTAAAEILKDACHESGDVHQAQEKMMQKMQSLNIQAKMCQFDG